MLEMLTYPRSTTGSEEEAGAAETDTATESTADKVQQFSIMMFWRRSLRKRYLRTRRGKSSIKSAQQRLVPQTFPCLRICTTWYIGRRQVSRAAWGGRLLSVEDGGRWSQLPKRARFHSMTDDGPMNPIAHALALLPHIWCLENGDVANLSPVKQAARMEEPRFILRQ